MGTKLTRHFANHQWGTVPGNGGQRCAFAHPTGLTVIFIDDKKRCVLSPLSAVQERILSLLGFTTTIYLALSG